jgi:tryptophanyl-tRNA synthetase
MSHFDTEISELQKKIIHLEEKKQEQREKDLQQINNPLNILKNIIDEKRKHIELNSNSVTRLSDRKKIAVLEPIVNLFKNIEDRLEKLEKKD